MPTSNTGASQERTLPPSIYSPNKTSDVSTEQANAYTAAKASYEQGDYQNTLDIVENTLLGTPSSIQLDAYLLAALSAANLDNATNALRYLNQAGQLPAARHPDNQNRLQDTHATILEYFGNWLAAVNLRMDLTYNLPLGEGEDNQAKLWLAVQNLTQQEISELYIKQKPLLNGWLAVSDILRNQALSTEQQLTVFERWRVDNPDHPAALSPPLDFQVMTSVKEMAPQRIVLMLPMTGQLARASQAIVDGFFASYYNQKEAKASVHIINVSHYSNINDALAAANEKQPDVIIGPLQKNNVAQISRLDLPYPVIALNQLDINQHPKNLYHFSLTAEDDIQELITFAKQEGATKAAILSIQDTWALKQSDEFRAAAEKANVTITSNQAYANTPLGRQNAVQSLLLINESYARKRLVEQWSGEKVDSIARSRKDLDYVYYIGKLDDAKQIRPLLDFYFADQIPMLASSTLNDSAPDRSTKDEDIERILFTEAPALIPTSKIDNALTKIQSSNILQRLQALGADAYLLANKHPLFTLLPSTKISANTGIITMDENGIFHKRPEIMTYRKGSLVHATNNQFFQSAEDSEK
ncbi:penicillin-binding protein activator [Marinomonas profundi]|uniref:penicillin-binding protein activator n=1 Tax=Marinomonas profundi TaxID=2726122 RepID=UPI001D125658|nr:penicillin-binding protein activator [Marinomonas profundi]